MILIKMIGQDQILDAQDVWRQEVFSGIINNNMTKISIDESSRNAKLMMCVDCRKLLISDEENKTWHEIFEQNVCFGCDSKLHERIDNNIKFYKTSVVEVI